MCLSVVQSQEQQQQGGDGSGGASAPAEDCAVCLSSMEGAPVMVLGCAHYFCEPCVRNLLRQGKQGNKCPTCRRVFRRSEVNKVHNIAKAAQDLQERTGGGAEERKGASDDDDHEADEEDEDEGAAGGAEAVGGPLDVSGVVGSWGTKVRSTRRQQQQGVSRTGEEGGEDGGLQG